MRRVFLVLVSVWVASCSMSSHLSRSGSSGGASAGMPPSVRAEQQSQTQLPVTDGGYWLQLSADDSTSMASAQLARLGNRSGLHRHEFINYYDPAPALTDAEPWALKADVSDTIKLGASLVLSTTTDGGQQADLLLQLRAQPVAPETRRPWNLVYCVDVSGSMEGDKIAFTRDALNRSFAHLRAGDHVSLVTFASDAEKVIDFARWPDDEARVRAAVDGLEATSSTNMIAGMNFAYDIAAAHRTAGVLTRVLLFGDGDANVGDTDVQRFAALTRNGNDEGIYLSSVGVGFDFDWSRMDLLADSGKGASIFLPDAQEVTRMFERDFYKLVEVSADEVQVELVLDNGFQLLDFSGEETSIDPNHRVPSTILSSGDDLTILARFSVTPEALAAPLSLRVSYKPLGTGVLVTHDTHVDEAQSLTAAGGALYTRTKLVDDYARSVTTGIPGRDEVKAAIAPLAPNDPGLAEILALLSK